MAQRLGPALLERASHVDLVVGPDGYRALPALIAGAREGRRAANVEFDIEEHYEDFSARRFEGVRAWVPVQRGCDYKCTYCIVPTTRGPERSRRLADVVREAHEIAAQGITEITLLGQTVNSYHDGEHEFGALLRAVGAVSGIRRAAVHEPAPQRFLRAQCSPRWRRRLRSASTCICPCSRAAIARSSACCAVTRATNTSRAPSGCARRSPDWR